MKCQNWLKSVLKRDVYLIGSEYFRFESFDQFYKMYNNDMMIVGLVNTSFAYDTLTIICSFSHDHASETK